MAREAVHNSRLTFDTKLVALCILQSCRLLPKLGPSASSGRQRMRAGYQVLTGLNAILCGSSSV